MSQENLEKQYGKFVLLLKSEQNRDGFWSGRLSSSALGTAVAIVALKINPNNSDDKLVTSGLIWLLDHINTDGGYGDTPESRSNISTSLLCYGAISYCGEGSTSAEEALSRIRNYLLENKIDLSQGNITSTILEAYGNDYTFSVPILSMLVICGVLDAETCRKIPQLPFEFALLPARWYSLFNLRVVSYAIPALIAVGIFVFKNRRHHNPVMKWIRNRSIPSVMRKLGSIVPKSGGFLEAIPLTAFVAMCLYSAGQGNSEVATEGISFLRNQQRPDGSWPIDTDLSTWVTTLSVKALGSQMETVFSGIETDRIVSHLISIQYKEIHPFNLALPGGWGWTSFSGSVPDVDDTAGVILALLELYRADNKINEAIISGCHWLTILQNKDGGFPTFCKGWGRLPFDSSCSDLTGHALLALSRSLDILGNTMQPELKRSLEQCIPRAFGFLWKNQQDNGCWYPLWFGNQFTPEKKNPVYGTSKVFIYLKDSLLCANLDVQMKKNIGQMLSKAQIYLLNQQNGDGSWGGETGTPGTIEECSLAISALTARSNEACLKGFEWLENEYNKNGLRSNPIGLYFAMLWYDEKLYPLIYYVEALRRFLKQT